MTRSVWRKRLKKIGLLLSIMMLGLWIFSVLFSSQYQPRGHTWSVNVIFGQIYFSDLFEPNDPGWNCGRVKVVVQNMPWTVYAHDFLGFAFPGKVRAPFTGVRIPVWLLLVAVGFPTAVLWWRDRRPKAGLCKVCKYDLTGNISGTCPECGTAVDASQHADKPPRGGV